jgi:hypothetical protein
MICDELRAYLNMISGTIKLYNKEKDINTTKIYMTQYKNNDYNNFYRLHNDNYKLDMKIKTLEREFVVFYNGYLSMCSE